MLSSLWSSRVEEASRAQMLLRDNEIPDWAFEQIAHLHIVQLEAGFLASLGSAVVERIYRYAAGHPHATVIVSIDDTRVFGFVMGVASQKGFYLHFVIRNVSLLAAAIAAQPSLIPRVLSGSRQAFGSARIDFPELLSIAVAPTVERQGIGTELLRAFSRYIAINAKAVFRVIAAETQANALTFYQKNGGKIIKEIDLGGLRSSVFEIPASDPPPMSGSNA